MNLRLFRSRREDQTTCNAKRFSSAPRSASWENNRRLRCFGYNGHWLQLFQLIFLASIFDAPAIRQDFGQTATVGGYALVCAQAFVNAGENNRSGTRGFTSWRALFYFVRHFRTEGFLAGTAGHKLRVSLIGII
jgi:hypothetical protein